MKSYPVAIKHKVMVLSGKGGTGKTTVAVNLAYAARRMGLKVGILDADIHGPNVPLMLGIVDARATVGEGNKIIPVEVEEGLQVMSIGFLLPSQDTPVIWRGPLKHKFLGQMVNDVAWGDLDVLFIDLPPGTGDEALSSAMLMKPVDGSIIVTLPQKVSLMDASKAINFSKQIGVEVLGIIENMSGYTDPLTGEKFEIFKAGGGKLLAEKYGIAFLGSVPLDPRVVECGDSGTPVVKKYPNSAAAKAFMKIMEALWGILEPQSS